MGVSTPEGVVFGRAGFRAYHLKGDGWTIILSKVNKADAEPRGLFTVFAPRAADSFSDLGGLILSRHAGIFGGSNLGGLSQDLAVRLGSDAKAWARRLDYLAQRVVLDGVADGSSEDFEGTPPKPDAPVYVFEGRMRQGRTISLFGPGSAGKTTIADALLVSASTGREIVPDWRPTRAFEVGTLDWDEGREETQVRLHAICNAYGLNLRGYHYQHLTRPLADCADEAGRWVVEKRVELLCISPVQRAIRPTSGDPGDPIREMYEVLGEFGTTNLLIDHVRGDAIKRVAERAYGAVAKTDNSRGSYSVYEQSQEPGRRVVVLRNAKPASLEPYRAPAAVRIEFDPPWPDSAGSYDAITFGEDVVVEAQPETPARESQIQKFVRLLTEHGPITSGELALLGGFRADYIRHLAAKARKAGFMVLCDSESRYSLGDTDDGLGV